MEFTIGNNPTPEPADGDAPAPKRRGRPPGSATAGKRPAAPSSTAKDKANVASALATMTSAYGALSMAAMLMRKPLTAELISTNLDQWQTANQKAFESSPRLAASIAGVGQTSGVAIFAVTNIVAMSTVFMAFREESALTAPKNGEGSDGG